jgi:hypothetical protein
MKKIAYCFLSGSFPLGGKAGMWVSAAVVKSPFTLANTKAAIANW